MLNRSTLSWVARVVAAVLITGGGALALRVGEHETAAVELRDPTVWLTTSPTGEVVQANGTTGEVVARVSVGEPGDQLQAVQRGSSVVVLNRTRGEVGLVDSLTYKVVSYETVGASGPILVDGGDRVFVVGEGESAELSTEDGLSVSTRFQLDAVSSAAADAGGVWIVGGESVRWVSDGTASVELARTDVSRLAAASAGGEVYLVDGAGASFGQASDGELDRKGCIGAEVSSVASVAGSPVGAAPVVLVVPDPATGNVHLAYPDGGDCRTVDLGTGPTDFGLAVQIGARVYLPLTDLAAVAVIDAGSGRLVNTIALDGVSPGSPVELIVKDGIVWYNDPLGAAAGVLGSSSVIRTVDKLEGGLEGPGVTGVVEGDEPGEVTGVGDVEGGLEGSEGEGVGEGTGSSQDPAATPGDGEDRIPGGSNDVDQELGRPVAPVAPQATDALVADFTFSSGTVAVGEVVRFTDASTGSPIAWTWDFGDGNVGSGPRVEHSWAEPGTYTVTLLVEDGTTSDEASAVIRVHPPEESPPRADFDYSTSTAEVGEEVVFTSTSGGQGLSLSWSFGDGQTATGRTARHSWSTPGSYTVTLTATNDSGTDTAEVVIEVVRAVNAPRAVIQTNASQLLVGQSATFTSASTGNPTTTEWRFGDGAVERGTTVRHAWDKPGRYTVELRVSNSAGQDRTTVQVTVVELKVPPVARFAVSATTAQNGETITFTNTSTGNPTSVEWDFGDGTKATGNSVTHSYDRPGPYTVRLTVRNDVGSDTTTKALTIVANLPPPVPSFTVSPTTVRVGDLVQFTDISTGGPVSSWKWDFDDGSTSTSQNPTHIFTAPGNYKVTLTTTNIAGSPTASRTINVLPQPPVASFTFSPAAPRQGDTVTFTDTSTGDPTGREWTFQDGTTASGPTATKVINAIGPFEVTLTVRNAGGATSVTRTVNVEPPPPVAAFGAPGTATAGEPVTFTNSSTGVVPMEFTWDFGDGTTSSEANPTHTYLTDGPKTVTLVVRNAGGTASATRTIQVSYPPPPSAAFTAPATVIVNTPVTFQNTTTGSGNITYQWSFGDGGTSTQASPTHSFPNTGTFTVKLTATNLGGSSTVEKQVKVELPTPTAAFAFTTTNLGVAFTNQSTNATTYEWDFGDGSPTSTEVNPSHTYAGPGNYTVTLKVANAEKSAEVSRTVRVFTVSMNAPTVIGGLVTFVPTLNGSPGGNVTWLWDWGDGTTSDLPVHTYGADGTYPVRVTVTGPNGIATAGPVNVKVDLLLEGLLPELPLIG